MLPQIEGFGFCGRGEPRDFICDGHIVPVNTHGGQIGDACIHGLNSVAQAARQVRGSAVNQVSGVEHALVTAMSTGGFILGVD